MMMKKQLFTLMALLAMALGMQAQSLVGTWKTAPVKDKDGDASTVTITFGQSGQASMKVVSNTSDPEVGTVVISFTMPGTYKRDGNTVNASFKAANGVAKMEKFEPVGDMKELMKDPDTAKMMMDMINKEMAEELKKEFSDNAPLDGDLTIKKLTATELVVDDGGDTMSLTRVK